MRIIKNKIYSRKNKFNFIFSSIRNIYIKSRMTILNLKKLLNTFIHNVLTINSKINKFYFER